MAVVEEGFDGPEQIGKLNKLHHTRTLRERINQFLGFLAYFARLTQHTFLDLAKVVSRTPWKEISDIFPEPIRLNVRREWVSRRASTLLNHPRLVFQVRATGLYGDAVIDRDAVKSIMMKEISMSRNSRKLTRGGQSNTDEQLLPSA